MRWIYLRVFLIRSINIKFEFRILNIIWLRLFYSTCFYCSILYQRWCLNLVVFTIKYRVIIALLIELIPKVALILLIVPINLTLDRLLFNYILFFRKQPRNLNRLCHFFILREAYREAFWEAYTLKINTFIGSLA